MNHGKSILCLAAVAMLFTIGYKTGAVNADETIKPAKIGVVSIGTIMQNSKANAKWVEMMKERDAAAKKELTDLQTELKAIGEASKKFKPDSDEYNEKMRQYMDKGTMLEAKNNFYNQDFELRKQLWAEKHFNQVIEMIEKVAKDKGIDVVLAKENFNTPNPSLDEVMLTIRTSKILYNSQNLEITQAVLDALDASN
ncbi:MAG: OmpH family outer membrane protein [Anaerohalosphaera sp.]|nr:OmpH family outer membrane protein [Anaerohalosphaera sp.]